MVIRGIHLSAYVVKVWWLLYAVHRAVFEVRLICFYPPYALRCEWRRGMFAYVGGSEDRSILGER